MAINVVLPILIPLEENLHNATRLFTGAGEGPLEFTQPRYCAVLREDAKLAAEVLSVKAIHKEGEIVRYSITGGNRDGLFTIDQHTGLITLAAALDYELYDKHELVVSGEAGGHTVHTIVQVRVADVNDNPPFFVKQDPKVTVIEEDDRHLPTTLLKVEARDKDDLDYQGLLYTVRGDGVDGYKPADAYFTVNSLTGELIQQRALDRDPPWGKAIWKVRVQVRDGQALWSRPRDKRQVPSSKMKKPFSPDNPLKGRGGVQRINEKKGRKQNTVTGDFGVLKKKTPKGRKEDERHLSSDVLLKGQKLTTKNFREETAPMKSFDGHQFSDSFNIWNDERKITEVSFAEKKSKWPLKNLMEPSTNGGENEKIIQPYLFSKKNRKLHRVIDPTSEWNRKEKGKASVSTNEIYGTPPTEWKEYHRSVSKREVVDMFSLKERFVDSPHKVSELSLASERNQASNSSYSEEGEKQRKSWRISGYLDPQQSRISAQWSETSLDLQTEKKRRDETRKPYLLELFKNKRRKRRRAILDNDDGGGGGEGYGDLSDPPEEHPYEYGSFSLDGGCDDEDGLFSMKKNITLDPSDPWANTDLSAYGSGGRIGRVHVVETIVTLYVKDINDNPPVFPNATMFGEVQENGPIDLSVAVVSAWDADDANEGSNAKITYSIEKNVVHEKTGEAIFSVHPRTGLLSTAVCCLDRETTPEYYIQVVATDGGGLKGSGTVIVRLADVNDNSPRLSKKMWKVEIDETWGSGPPDNSTVLELSVNDRDTANYFFYRVVEESGWGWSHFGIKSVGTIGHLYARQTLDYEDDTHRRGFKFMIQVTDRGRGGWIDPKHLDSAWVQVRLRDVNDNPPMFQRAHAQVTVKEDAPPGYLLATLPAHDPDMGGKQGVEYRIVGGWGSLEVDSEGGVSLWRSLDRESPNGAMGMAQVMAVDSGNPPLTSTATLTITVTDVNDCPPRLLTPTVFHVTEGAPSTLLGVLTATDHDVWALGHGPPFTFALASSNPPLIAAHIDVKFDAHLDSGRGGAQIWTKDALDREQYRELAVGIEIKDAGGLADTQVVMVIVDDVNDNPMKPASKTVYLWKTQSGSSDAPLGRVYVDDPDDWDIGDKVFHWLGMPHPLFSLNKRDGTIFASSQVREGRYELRFVVSDTLWGQKDVSANVTVAVRLLSQEALAHSTPITLSPATPQKLTAQWHPLKGGGGLGQLIEGVKEVVGEIVSSVEIVSIYGMSDDEEKASPSPSSSSSSSLPSNHFAKSSSSSSDALASSSPSSSFSSSDSQASFTSSSSSSSSSTSTCVWLSIKQKSGKFMDPVKLQGILGLHSQELEKSTNLTVIVETSTSVLSRKRKNGNLKNSAFESSLSELDSFSTPTILDPLDPSSAASRASTSLPLQVVDTNSTSLVTPRLSRATHCSLQEPEACTATSCLNGGRCIPTQQGNKCVCPGGSWGFQCKILSRTFHGDGFAWIRPLPPCIPTMISLRVLTKEESALLLYAGPLVPRTVRSWSSPSPLLVLQVVQGEVQMIVEGGTDTLKLQVGAQINDGNWHVIHAKLDDEGVSLMVDLCGSGWEKEDENDLHCAKRTSWRNREDAELWFSGAPIQIGGLAHTVPISKDHGWRDTVISHPLDGCLSHLVINGQLMDLGEPAFTAGSSTGCSPAESPCSYSPGTCGIRGTCVAGLNEPECRCQPGWSGPKCDIPTVPASFGTKSYVKMALSFTPASRVISTQVRIRTRGRSSGLVLRLGSKSSLENFSVKLEGGIACASVTLQRGSIRSVCVKGRPLGDGEWHIIKAEVYGHNMVVSVDDGDGWRQNYSLPSLDQVKNEGNGTPQQVLEDTRHPPAPFEVDEKDGVFVGGLPEFVGMKLIKVYDDLKDTCLDDLRISGHSLPLAPTVNSTTWGQVTTFERVESGCKTKDACANITCTSPLTCISSWGRPSCSCGQGRNLIGRTCEDVDECLWRPCLHGGSCYNMRPGFLCVCGPNYTGEHCQWNNYNSSLHPMAGPLAIAAITLSLLLLVAIGVIVSFRLKRLRATKKLASKGKSGSDDEISEVSCQEATIIDVREDTEGGGDGGGGGGGGEGGGGNGEAKSDNTREPLLESLSIRLPHIFPALQSKEKSSESTTGSRRPSKASLLVTAALLEGRAAVIGDETLLAKDDLRAYAYEGDGSSAGSLTSALSGLRVEQCEEGSIPPIVPGFLDVMDLLKNLPEASKTMLPHPQEVAEATSHTKEGGDTSVTGGILKTPLPADAPKGGASPLAPSGKSPKTKPKTNVEEISTIC